jgi:hypothetical protein
MSPSANQDLEMDLVKRPVNEQTLSVQNSSQAGSSDSNMISHLSTPQQALASSGSSPPPEAVGSGDSVSRHQRAPRTQDGDQGPDPPDNNPTDTASPGKSNFKQHRDTIILAILASLLLGFSTWLIYIEFIRQKKVPRHLELPPGKVITLVNVLSRVILFLVAMLVVASWEAIRKSMVARTNGISYTHFLAMSTALSYTQTRDILRIRGWHRMIVLTRLALSFRNQNASC